MSKDFAEIKNIIAESTRSKKRTCREFNVLNLSNKLIHLTNDAIQKKAEDYGKYEPGNKLSYIDLQNYLDKHFSHLNVYMDRDILP